MKEELYQLIDGELPDEASAEYFHELSVDPEQRSVFRQQMRLQNALHRNEQYGGLTSGEDEDLLSRLSPAIGIGTHDAIGWFRANALAMLLIGIVLGGGLGFLATKWVKNSDIPAQQTISQMPAEIPSGSVVLFNHDSIVSAIRDSLNQELVKSQAVTEEPKTKTVRKKSRYRSPYEPPTPGIPNKNK